MIIAATQNLHKLREMKEILNNFGMDIISIRESGLGEVKIVEDGETFEENSLKKAQEIMNLSGKDAIADDSGLSVDALQGRPGVYSARFSGENATDKKNNKKLLSVMEDVTDRSAKFISVISLCFTDGRRISVKGECTGKIGYEERGNNGFGYDPLFIPDGYEETFGELGKEVKNKISHRANALKKLREELERL